MNYRAMGPKQLTEELRKRKLGNPRLNNEITRFYGVTQPVPSQERAREEAVGLLEADDEDKRRLLRNVFAVIGVFASIASVGALIIEVLKITGWLHQ